MLNGRLVLLQYGGQTNNAIAAMKCGGVGRNLCDGMTRFGLRPAFLSALGKDVIGDEIMSSCNHMVFIT